MNIKKYMVLGMVWTGMFLFFFYSPVQGDEAVLNPLETIARRLEAKGGPAAIICLSSGEQWMKSNKQALQEKGINALPGNSPHSPALLNELKESHRARNNRYDKSLYIYNVTSQRLADRDFLELAAYHNDFFYLDEFSRFYSGDAARNKLLKKIAGVVGASGGETAILSFLNWFNYLYSNYGGSIPVSFTLFVPSKRRDGSDIPEEESDQVLTDFYNRIVSRVASGFSVFRAEGSWVLNSNDLQKENVKMATVDAVLDKTEIFTTTLLLMVQAMDVQTRLEQESVMIKVFGFPFFIGD